MEFQAEITVDHCQTTAKKRAVSEELCSDFCFELCMLLPLLLLYLQEQWHRKLLKVIDKSLHDHDIVNIIFIYKK